jgi:hypothetical protein
MAAPSTIVSAPSPGLKLHFAGSSEGPSKSSRNVSALAALAWTITSIAKSIQPPYVTATSLSLA